MQSFGNSVEVEYSCRVNIRLKLRWVTLGFMDEWEVIHNASTSIQYKNSEFDVSQTETVV